jgi:hypothetical protein
MVKRIVALTLIVVSTSVAWMFLSGVMHSRSNEADVTMSDAVGNLWGDAHAQAAPTGAMDWVETDRRDMNDEERLDYKNNRQTEEELKAKVEGREPRRVVVSVDEIKKIVHDSELYKRDAFLLRRQAEENALAKAGKREPKKVVLAEDDVNKAIKAGETFNTKRLTKPEQFVVLDEQASFNVADAPPAEYLVLPAESFIKVTQNAVSQPLDLAGSSIKLDLNLDYRQKGLLWFSTYNVTFDADYTLINPVDLPIKVTMLFPFPSERAIYDNLKVEAVGIADFKYESRHDDKNSRANDPIVATFTLTPKTTQVVKFFYKSRGLDQWTYSFGDRAQMVKNFKLVMDTNFDAIDFPRDSISPDDKQPKVPGWTLTWAKDSLVSAFQIGMVMPRRINPGPLAAAMSSHAPVSLLFFFFVVFLLQVLRDIKIHPMNYFFLAASFFAFNLLFSYLVDHIDLRVSFVLASTVSILLVGSYLWLVVGRRFALLEAGVSQFVYQILFAFAHFYEGYTGLAITVGAILTLAIVMRLTARIDWGKKFADNDWGGIRFSRGPKAPFAPPPLNPSVPGGQ